MPRKRSGSKETTSAAAIATAERTAEYLRLRVEGKTLEQIGGEFGISKQAVHQSIAQYVETLPAANAEELRFIQNERLEALYSELLTAFTSAKATSKTGDMLNIADRILRTLERQAKLNGLDKAVSVNIALFNDVRIQPVDYRDAAAPLLTEGDVVEGFYEYTDSEVTDT